MKSIHIMTLAVGLCVITQVQATESITNLTILPENRIADIYTPSDSVNNNFAWGTDKVNGNQASKLVRYFNAGDGEHKTAMPNSYILDLKPKGSEITHGSSLGAYGFVEQVWPLPDGSVLFSTQIAPNKYNYLYKLKAGKVGNNAPSYSNKQAVLNMGERNNVPQSDIYALHERSVLVAKVNGATVLFYGEYNVSNQDQVALWKSTDMGDTWTKTVEWNTTTHQTRHIHGVVQNPYNGWIYILFGDGDSESAIVAWDGVSPLPNNTALDQISTHVGWKCITGSQRVRAGDLVFTPEPNGKVVWIPDADSLKPGENLYGQRANYDLTGLEATGIVPFTQNRPAILGARSNTGNIYWASYRDQLAPEKKIDIWKSTDNGLSWLLATQLNTYTDWTAVPKNLTASGSVISNGVSRDLVTISSRDLEFDPAGEKYGSTVRFYSVTGTPKIPATSSALVTKADTVTTTRGVAAKSVDLTTNDGNPLADLKDSQYVIIKQPTHGILNVYSNYIDYTPNSDFDGVDNFTYALKNAAGISNTSNVKVYVMDDTDDIYTITADTAKSQTINITAAKGVARNDQPLKVSGRTFAIKRDIHRTARSGKADISLNFNTDGSFSYTMTASSYYGYSAEKIRAAKRGTYKFSYIMTLNGVSTTPTTVTITVR